jgi:transposase-like protein
MPALPPSKRAAIIETIKAGGKSTRQIAKEHGVGHVTVTKIAQQAGLTDAFDRTQTEKATAAKAADCRARREQLKADLLDDAERLRERAWSEYKVVVGTPTGAQIVSLDLPPLQDVRAAYAALSIAVDKHVKLEQYDTTDSASDAKSLLGTLSDALGIAARSLDGDEPEPE